MSKSSEAVRRWRRNTKRRIVQAMGGKCVICSFDKFDEALDLHHLDPSVKDFGFGAMRGNPKSWAKIVVELRKCVLVCANCHRGVEANILGVPDDATRFNEQFVDYRKICTVGMSG